MARTIEKRYTVLAYYLSVLIDYIDDHKNVVKSDAVDKVKAWVLNPCREDYIEYLISEDFLNNPYMYDTVYKRIHRILNPVDYTHLLKICTREEK